MIYAFILLSLVALLTVSVWDGMRAPDVDTAGVRARISEAYQDTKDKITGAVKEKARKELHEVVDDKLQ